MALESGTRALIVDCAHILSDGQCSRHRTPSLRTLFSSLVLWYRRITTKIIAVTELLVPCSVSLWDSSFELVAVDEYMATHQLQYSAVAVADRSLATANREHAASHTDDLPHDAEATSSVHWSDAVISLCRRIMDRQQWLYCAQYYKYVVLHDVIVKIIVNGQLIIELSRSKWKLLMTGDSRVVNC